MSNYVLHFRCPESNRAGFLSKDRELNIIYIDEDLTYNTIITHDGALAQTIYEQVHGFIMVETMKAFTDPLMLYLKELYPASEKYDIRQLEVVPMKMGYQLIERICLTGL